MYDEFLERLAAGDDAAWNDAYLPLCRDIYSVLKARVRADFGVDWESAASDIIVNEIMPALSQRRESFAALRDFEELRRLAKKIAAFRALDLIRKVSRKSENELLDELGIDLPATVDDEAEEMEHFEEIIGQLPPPKPDLFRDYFHLGYTYQEISDRRGMALGTVCCHFSRGLKQLAKILSEARAEGSRTS